MVQIAGNYTPTAFVNPELILKVVGGEVTEELLAGLKKVSVTFEVDGDNYCLASKFDENAVDENRFTLGKSYEEKRGAATTTVTKDGNTLTFSTTSAGGSYKRTYEFNDSGLVMNFSTPSGESAKITYKRT